MFCGVFDELFDFDEEGDGFFAVDEAVVVGEGEVHDGTDDDLAIDDDGSVHDVVHAEDGGLRGVDDGSGEHGAVDAAVGDGEDAALHVFDGDFA